MMFSSIKYNKMLHYNHIYFINSTCRKTAIISNLKGQSDKASILLFHEMHIRQCDYFLWSKFSIFNFCTKTESKWVNGEKQMKPTIVHSVHYQSNSESATSGRAVHNLLHSTPWGITWTKTQSYLSRTEFEARMTMKYRHMKKTDANCEEFTARLTKDIDLGLIESQTRPVKILVTANPKVKRSALDCELQKEHKLKFPTMPITHHNQISNINLIIKESNHAIQPFF